MLLSLATAITCHVSNGMQDSRCTKGAIIPSETAQVICNPIWTTKNVRNVPDSVKNQVFKNYGITSHSAGQYEIDHDISLELGGSNDISNLWPEPAIPLPGFREKDKVENLLHRMVCSNRMSLKQAQDGIVKNWKQYLPR